MQPPEIRSLNSRGVCVFYFLFFLLRQFEARTAEWDPGENHRHGHVCVCERAPHGLLARSLSMPKFPAAKLLKDKHSLDTCRVQTRFCINRTDLVVTITVPMLKCLKQHKKKRMLFCHSGSVALLNCLDPSETILGCNMSSANNDCLHWNAWVNVWIHCFDVSPRKKYTLSHQSKYNNES